MGVEGNILRANSRLVGDGCLRRNAQPSFWRVINSARGLCWIRPYCPQQWLQECILFLLLYLSFPAYTQVFPRITSQIDFLPTSFPFRLWFQTVPKQDIFLLKTSIIAHTMLIFSFWISHSLTYLLSDFQKNCNYLKKFWLSLSFLKVLCVQ